MEKDKITISLHDHRLVDFEYKSGTILYCSCGKSFNYWDEVDAFTRFNEHQKEMLNNQIEKVEVV